jgi:hypothetical protein
LFAEIITYSKDEDSNFSMGTTFLEKVACLKTKKIKLKSLKYSLHIRSLELMIYFYDAENNP